MRVGGFTTTKRESWALSALNGLLFLVSDTKCLTCASYFKARYCFVLIELGLLVVDIRSYFFLSALHCARFRLLSHLYSLLFIISGRKPTCFSRDNYHTNVCPKKSEIQAYKVYSVDVVYGVKSPSA